MDEVVNLGEARDTLSSLVDRASRGEGIIIAKRGRPVVRLVPCGEKPRKPTMGAWLKDAAPGDRAALDSLSDADWFETDPEIVAAMKAKGTW